MDQNKQGQAAEEGKEENNYQFNPMMAPRTNPPTQTIGRSVPSSYPQVQEEQLEQKLKNFWAKQYQEIEEGSSSRSRSLPLARIRKIMKADEGVSMVSAEAPVLFAKACEMFIMELTIRAWANAEENKRRILNKTDIASAMTKSDMYDFLLDIVPRKDTRDLQVFAGTPGTGNAENVPYVPMPPHQHVAGIPGTGNAPNPSENVPYYPMPPHPHVAGPQSGVPTMLMGRPILDQNHHGLQTNLSPTPMLPNPEQQNNHAPNSDD